MYCSFFCLSDCAYAFFKCVVDCFLLKLDNGITPFHLRLIFGLRKNRISLCISEEIVICIPPLHVSLVSMNLPMWDYIGAWILLSNIS